MPSSDLDKFNSLKEKQQELKNEISDARDTIHDNIILWNAYQKKLLEMIPALIQQGHCVSLDMVAPVK